MDKCVRTSTSVLSLFIILTPHILFVAGDGGKFSTQNMQEKPSLTKIVTDTISMLKKSHKNSWDKIKAIVHDMQLQFSPPNLDFRSADEAKTGSDVDEADATEMMKVAAKKSFGTSKMTVEESAKSAAKAMGEGMHKTADKVKQTMSHDEESHDEL